MNMGLHALEEVQDKKDWGSNLNLPFYFILFSKFLNLGHKFGINLNMPTFFLFFCFFIHLEDFIQFFYEKKSI